MLADHLQAISVRALVIKMKAVLLTGGLGTRLREETHLKRRDWQ